MATPMKSIWVQDMLNVMAQANNPSTKYVFLLGAGASFTSGIPTGEKMMPQWHQELLAREKNHPGYIQGQARLANYDWEKCKPLFEPNYTLRNEDYFSLYDLRFASNLEEGYNFLQQQMEGKTPSPGYYYLANILTKTSNNLVITTNFDPMTEEALFDVQRRHPLLLNHESLAPYLKLGAKRPIVAKIHRDLLLDPMNHQRDLQNLKKQWTIPLTVALTYYTPVVVGYAGGDQTLMKLLEKLKKDLPGIFWCTLKGKEPPSRARKILEANPNGHWVEIDGFDELMFQIAQRLVCLPAPDDMRQSARARLDNFQKQHEALQQKYQSASTNAKEDGTPQDTGMQQAVLQEAANQADKTGDGSKEAYYTHLAEAARLRSMGQLEAALEEYSEAIRLQPDEALPYNNRSVILHIMGRYEEALEDKNHAIKLQSDNAQFYDSRSTTLHEMGRYQEALEDSNRAIQLQPDNANFYNNRGVTLRKMERYEEALEDHNHAIKLQPDNAKFYRSRGVTLHKMGRYQEALEDYNRAIKLQPDNAESYCVRNIILCIMKQYEEALEDCNHAIKLQPDNAEFYWSRGVTLREMGRYEEALEDCNHAIQLQPNNADLYDSRAITLRKMGRYEEALEDCNHAIRLQPDNAEFYDSRGITLHEMGRYEEALEDENHAIQLQPDNADLYDSRAITLRAMGREDEAKADEERANALRNPKQP